MGRGKARTPTQAELVDRERSRREAHAELERLKEHYPTLRQTLTPEAITATWFLLGDAMFEQPST